MAKRYKFSSGLYESISFIGEGSYGKVYKVFKIKGNSKDFYAVKTISIRKSQQEIDNLVNEGLGSNEIKNELKEILDKCVNEIKLLGKLKNSVNVVNILDCEILPDDSGYGWVINILMEYLQTLEDYFENRKITNRDIIKLGIDISKALEDCEKIKIIHRDIKPDNIFVDKNGNFKLGDFGIARNLEKTMSGLSQKGTFNYMAPEVYRGEKYNKTIDIYSLGLVMFRYFNYNRLPFLPDYPNQITLKDRNEAIVRRNSGEKILKPLNADDNESCVILKMLSFKPGDRYANALVLRKDLEKLSNEEERELPVIERKVSYSEQNSLTLNKKNSKNKLILIFPILLVFIVGIISFFSFYTFVPDVIGDSSTKAVNKLDKCDLLYSIKYKEVSNEKNVGNVISQRKRNKLVKKNTKIHIVIGISNKKVEMPDLANCYKNDAADILKKLGLKANFSEKSSDVVELNYIISQMIPKGTMVNKGTVVDLLVSSGKDGWSDWIDSLPDNINKNNSNIEEKKFYSYRNKETTTSDNSYLEGWTLYKTSGEDNYKEVSRSVSNSEYVNIKDNFDIISASVSRIKFTCYTCKVSSLTNSNSVAANSNYNCDSGELYSFVVEEDYSTLSSVTDGKVVNRGNSSGVFYNCRVGNLTNTMWNVKYKEKVSGKTYYFYKWSDWSGYQENKISENESREVRTKTQYRYKRK